MKRIIAPLLIIAVFGLFLSCDNGGKILILLGATHHSANEGTSVLYVINMTDFTATEIGDIGYGINGLAFDVANSKLYATTTNKDSSFPDGLIEIDMVTGAGTRIGTGAGMQVLNPTINSSGTMFAWTEYNAADDLVAVDTAAGTATVVGESGLDTAEHSLAFDAEDTLYLVNYDGVYIIDTTTGDGGESIGTIDFSSHPDYELAHHGDFNPDTGMLWALDTTNDYTSTRNILVVDLDDFTIGDIISTIDDLHVLVFAYQ